MGLRSLQRFLYGIRNAVRRPGRKMRVERPPDPREDADPWLASMLDNLGERYRLGPDLADGIQVLRRTGRARFNPMRVYLQPAHRIVAGDYDVRVREGKTVADGRVLLERKVSGPLASLGLKPVSETVEEWGGQVIVRRYEGSCPDSLTAAAAVRFICEESEQVLDAAAE